MKIIIEIDDAHNAKIVAAACLDTLEELGANVHHNLPQSVLTCRRIPVGPSSVTRTTLSGAPVDLRY